MESITLFNTVFHPHTFPLLATIGLVVLAGIVGLAVTLLSEDLQIGMHSLTGPYKGPFGGCKRGVT